MSDWPDIPHVVVGLGYGAFGVGAGTFNDLPAVAIIPSQDWKAHPERVGETMIEGELSEPLPGTIVIVFKDRAAIERHRDLLDQLLVGAPNI